MLLSSIPSTGLGNSFVFFDMHSEGLVHYFEGSALRLELSGQDVLGDAIKSLRLDNFMFGTTDFGQPKRVEKVCFPLFAGLWLYSLVLFVFVFLFVPVVCSQVSDRYCVHARWPRRNSRQD
jgi:hypothetical protein